jgi:hypothetical protein
LDCPVRKLLAISSGFHFLSLRSEDENKNWQNFIGIYEEKLIVLHSMSWLLKALLAKILARRPAFFPFGLPEMSHFFLLVWFYGIVWQIGLGFPHPHKYEHIAFPLSVYRYILRILSIWWLVRPVSVSDTGARVFPFSMAQEPLLCLRVVQPIK